MLLMHQLAFAGCSSGSCDVKCDRGEPKKGNTGGVFLTPSVISPMPELSMRGRGTCGKQMTFSSVMESEVDSGI